MLFKGWVLDFYCPRQLKWLWNVAPRPYKIYSGNSTEIQNCMQWRAMACLVQKLGSQEAILKSYMDSFEKIFLGL